MWALRVGNLAQVNPISLPLAKWVKIAIAFLVGIVILGGIQRVAKLAAVIVLP
ncbi:hypothetical protein [Parachlamydia sp. AcF125]|uniref:hypothetical protein n=1 Tax=Parachlamydia sp. AcF125 TaxID=2795736 RepID=UPI002015E918|nr:hypothetical protein [Parachlamydia sp. AcF125]